MKKLLVLLSLFLYDLSFSQTIEVIPIGDIDVSDVRVEVEHYVTTSTGNLDVKIFSTHYGNGNTSPYQMFAFNSSDMDKMVTSGYPGTNLHWQGSIPATTALNFNWGGALVSAGAQVPNNYDFYSVEATCIFVPKETGSYSFRLTSDDGADLFINGVNILNYYGGHGMSPFYYTNYNMIAGQQYTFKARMQEYGGGDGLIVQWKRPSQSSWQVQPDEIGVSSSGWVSQGVKRTDVLGLASFSNPSSLPYRATINCSDNNHILIDDDMLYLHQLRMFQGNMISWDYYTADINEDMNFKYDDLVLASLKISQQIYAKKYLFTQTEKILIESNPTTDYSSAILGTQQRIIQNETKIYLLGIGKGQFLTYINKMQ